MSVSVHALTKTYGTQKAVDNLSFEAQKGEILGFLGPNGAGKSTTMKISTGYLKPTSGTVKVCGLDVTEQPTEIKKHIGYLPEHNPLYLDMYILEYLQFVGEIHQMRGKKLAHRIAEMMELCGLTPERNKKIGALSKGYRQRVGLAQALIHDPQVLILDEPTSGLDPNQILEIREVIRNVSQEKTLIFSTHIMQEVKALCDRVVIIDQGKIVADSPVSQLNPDTQRKRIRLEFLEELEIQILQNLEGILEINQIAPNRYEIMTETKVDIRPNLFRLAVENQKILLEMTQEEATLEEVFHKLTTKNPKNSSNISA